MVGGGSRVQGFRPACIKRVYLNAACACQVQPVRWSAVVLAA